jgi:hypothetical protein
LETIQQPKIYLYETAIRMIRISRDASFELNDLMILKEIAGGVKVSLLSLYSEPTQQLGSNYFVIDHPP